MYINPVIVTAEGAETDDEGCLSVPDVFLRIERPAIVHIRAQDLDGKFFERDGTGYLARAYCHETDHLNGSLIVDLVTAPQRKALEARFAKKEQ